jgi:hypothetical protein
LQVSFLPTTVVSKSLAILSFATLTILVCEFGATDIFGAGAGAGLGAASQLGLLVTVVVIVPHEDPPPQRAADETVGS